MLPETGTDLGRGFKEENGLLLKTADISRILLAVLEPSIMRRFGRCEHHVTITIMPAARATGGGFGR